MTTLYQAPGYVATLGFDQIQAGDIPAIYRKHTGDRAALGFDNASIMCGVFGPFHYPGVTNTAKVRLRGYKLTGAGAGDCPLDVHIEARKPGGAGTGVAPSFDVANTGTLLLPAEDRLEELLTTLTNIDGATAGDSIRILVRRPSAGTLAGLCWLDSIAFVDEV